jgi:hypothetical protein
MVRFFRDSGSPSRRARPAEPTPYAKPPAIDTHSLSHLPDAMIADVSLTGLFFEIV